MTKKSKKPSLAAKKTERLPSKLRKGLKAKGYKDGKAPAGKEAHHVKPVAEGGKTIPGNIRVIDKDKHKKIHQNRRKKGKV